MKKIFLDFLPITIFFIIYKTKDIFAATLALMIATLLQVAYEFITKKKVPMLQVVSLILILIFGSTTILLHDAQLIKWKVTIVSWFFAIAFFVSSYYFKKPILQKLLESNIKMPTATWRRFNNSWGCFFLFQGLVNLFVMYNFSTDIWVDFKLFGMLGMTLVFVIAQGFFFAKYAKNNDNK
jgi:intracellular septation protein